MKDNFIDYLAEIRARTSALASISEEKDINYGHQFTFQGEEEKVSLAVYNGKKGRRLVWRGKGGPLEQALTQAVEAPRVILQRPHQDTSQHISHQQAAPATTYSQPLWPGLWAGSDESGKGDFIGPLVVAATVVDLDTAAKLQAAGVKDCKALTDKKILELEPVIKKLVVAHAVLELKPKVYNMRYQQLKDRGGNLNQLLSLGHIAALSRVLEAQPHCQGALIDQFTKSNAILLALSQSFPQVDFRQRPKAESDLAVAAASVLARAAFLHHMEALSLEAGELLPKGGGSQATAAAQRIVDRLGREQLGNFVKLHFANCNKIHS